MITPFSEDELIEINKELVGKEVFITAGSFHGMVEKVIDSQTYLISNGKYNRRVDIHHIRYYGN